MKYIYVTLFMSIFWINLSAQTDFMPIGSNLYTYFVSLGFSGSAVFNAEKDTICDGLLCRKINIFKKDKRTNIIYKDSVFFQQRGDSIFEYSQYFKKSFFLFKNKYAIGDSLLIQRLIGTTNVTVATIYIDSIISFNGIKRYASRIKCRPINTNYPTVINEFNLYDRFFPFYNWDIHLYCQAAYYDGLSYVPLCYSDNTTNYKSIYYNGSCDSIRTMTSVKEIDNDVKIFPNPAHSFLTVTGTGMPFITVIIKNINGVEMLKKIIALSNIIDINDLPNGMYILSIKGDKGFFKAQKLIIQH